MHPSAHAHMALSVKRYMKKGRSYRVVDFGSRCAGSQTLTHRELLREHDCEYIGVDVQPGRNVDVVMRKPYRIPLKANSSDVVLSGQVLEHVPFFWVSLLEIARVLKPGGYLFLTVPSRGHPHDAYDCWRFYPDGIRALGAFAGLDVEEVHTDFPPTTGRRRHDYSAIDTANHYWGDTVGVFRKPNRYPSARMWVVRAVTAWRANRVGDLSKTPAPRVLKRRKRVLGSPSA